MKSSLAILCALVCSARLSSQTTRTPESLPLPPSGLLQPTLMQKALSSEAFGKDPFCGGYSPQRRCAFCYSSYFDLAANKCVAPRESLEHCLFYLNEEFCLGCDFGFHLDLDSGRCRPNSTANCKNEFQGMCMVTAWTPDRRSVSRANSKTEPATPPTPATPLRTAPPAKPRRPRAAP